jgi:predicted ATPase
MSIKKIGISNFKSFDNLDVELGKFNVLIGANASGKSNFLQIFRFLKNVANHGLNNAISMQGGVEYLRNTRIGSSKGFSLKVVYTPDTKWDVSREKEKRLIRASTYELIYEFTLEFTKRGRGFKVSEDKLTQRLDFFELEKRKDEIEQKEKLGSGEIVLSNVGGKLKSNFNLPETVPVHDSKDLFLPLFREINFSHIFNRIELPSKTLFLETPFFSLVNPFEKLFDDISIYDFDPKLPKKAVSITGKTELEEDGSNLAIVLKNIIEDKEKKRKFSNLIKDLLPFIDDLRVEKFADKSLIFALQEIYAQKLYLPASFISDGTINITALIIALYFEKKPLIILEEPERNIHPFLISKVVNMLEEASEKKQIIVTTHNPEIIKYADLDNILLISRNKEGFSTISRPSEKEEIKLFLENEIGVEELYIQDLLRV